MPASSIASRSTRSSRSTASRGRGRGPSRAVVWRTTAASPSVDADGRFVNGKRTAAVHHIRAEYDLANMTVQFHDTRDDTAEFSLADSRTRNRPRGSPTALGHRLHSSGKRGCRLPRRHRRPRPDAHQHRHARAKSHSWFPGLTLDETRRRFRANLEIDGVEPFWEDQLVGPRRQRSSVPNRRASIGSASILASAASSRRAKPTPAERRRASKRRSPSVASESLPAWAPGDRFNHFYRLAVNTRLAPGQSPSARLRVGDAVTPGSIGVPYIRHNRPSRLYWRLGDNLTGSGLPRG